VIHWQGRDSMRADILFISFNRKNEVIYNLNMMDSFTEVNRIIWVDNGSKDGTAEIDEKKYSKVQAIRLPENICIAAYNRGAALSESDILIILDDDSYVTNESILKAKLRFEEDEKLGALGFQIVLPSTGAIVTNDWKNGDATYFWGCGAAIRTAVWKRLGGYREELLLYANEYDLSIRIWELGYKVQFTDEITAYHRVSRMNRTSGRLIFYSVRNNYRYIMTYFSPKYQKKLIRRDRLVWYIRAILCKSVDAYREGIKTTQEMKINAYPVSDEIQQFYIDNQRIFETLLKKICRKIKYKKLFNVSKDV